ncbi:MAG TPA: NrfD/PsrC family molybdoenzyme membrane anchor subunit, partial [Candidatus Binataceae bacterium]|nr:NrfD/PsrC family molybdoenzyme membrane anchor subunit [Candidatus Binataceae bacterium]
MTTVTHTVTKAPPWHGWVTADLSLNSLSTGVFAVAALCDLIGDLIGSAAYRPVVRIGYLAAFPLVLCDLACLILDLGDPARFLHMLRVFKPGSPMSVGVWSTSVFSGFAFMAWSLEIFDRSGFPAARVTIAVAGIVAALITAGYKGVLLSTTAQPGWKDSRWLGAELSISSGASGTAFLLAFAAILDAQPAMADLRAVLATVLILDLAAASVVAYEMRRAILARFTRAEIAGWYAAMLGGGGLAPLILIAASAAAPASIAAAVLTILGAIAMRHHLVMIPHRDVHDRRDAGPTSDRAEAGATGIQRSEVGPASRR